MRLGGDQLREWMERRGVNQTETALKLGMPLSLLSMFVNGHRNPGLTNAIKIERATGIPVEAWMATDVHESDDPLATGTGNRKYHKA